MKAMAKAFMLVILMSIVTACCDRRCGVHGPECPEPINLQEKLTKMKEQAGDKGSK